ncbi:MAG TPA: glycerol-3-phosphate dehydrogenase [Alphaproteobacteria bacterium]|nr:glycerol-3-phosphate dehydrogenase [Alphaproteobacteria bacterium]HNS44406.1 glycerol-3-phosphate dehydrogenase [Alphaproteobacteria bacterium]
MADFDLCIIGGGINGAGIARDAAGRGLKVLLVEQGDLASCTSSASSKMIHGGLRYLEFFEFGLVRKSLAEREVLMGIAPQIIWPLEFCIPHKNAIRPAWMVRLGLYLYDHLWPRKTLPASGQVNLARHEYGEPLKNGEGVGFTYADCWVDDARLVVLNVLDASSHGATVKTYTRCEKIEPLSCGWKVTLKDLLADKEEHHTARVVVNATGPYAYEFLKSTGQVMSDTPKLRLVQGAHIVVPRLYIGTQAYLLQMPDKRVIFVFPYGDYTLCGTTETDFNGDPVESAALPSEIQYLCDALNENFRRKTAPKDVIWSFAGVRPLFEDHETDARKVSRDYRFYEDKSSGNLLLSVFGGKLTTYRTLTEEVMAVVRGEFPSMRESWTATKKLPDCPVDFSKPPTDDDLRYFIKKEYARRSEDILWRRTKWGLTLPPNEVELIKKKVPALVKEITGHDAA